MHDMQRIVLPPLNDYPAPGRRQIRLPQDLEAAVVELHRPVVSNHPRLFMAKDRVQIDTPAGTRLMRISSGLAAAR